MALTDRITAVAAELPEARQEELLNFAQFLRMQEERNEWRSVAQANFVKAYGDDEPEYTEADLKAAQP